MLFLYQEGEVFMNTKSERDQKLANLRDLHLDVVLHNVQALLFFDPDEETIAILIKIKSLIEQMKAQGKE